MTFVLSWVLGAAIFAIGLWLSLRLLDGGNSRNKFGTALFFGAAFAIPNALGLGGFLGLLPLLALLLLLFRYYEVGLVRSIFVVILMGAINLGVALLLAHVFVLFSIG